MAFGRHPLGSGGAGRGNGAKGSGARPLSDINVTPLVDVMLVLLVIFIITAPLMASSIRLDLPKTDAGLPVDAPKSVSLAVDRSGQIFLNGQAVTSDALALRLTAAAEASRDTEVQLRADETVPYGRIVELMGIANKAGLTRIGFVTEAPALAAPASPAR